MQGSPLNKPAYKNDVQKAVLPVPVLPVINVTLFLTKPPCIFSSNPLMPVLNLATSVAKPETSPNCPNIDVPY
jgi:hypothetical protein